MQIRQLLSELDLVAVNLRVSEVLFALFLFGLEPSEALPERRPSREHPHNLYSRELVVVEDVFSARAVQVVSVLTGPVSTRITCTAESCQRVGLCDQ